MQFASKEDGVLSPPTLTVNSVLQQSNCNGLRPGTTDCNFDPLTGTHWLDVPLTLNTSFNSLVMTQLGPGQPLEGFRYATEDEIETLLQNYTATHSTIDPGQFLPPDVTIVPLISDLGITQSSPPTFVRTLGIYPGSNCPDPLTCSTGLVDVADLLFQSGSQSFSRSFAWSVTDPHPLIGHMLVVSGSAPTPDFVTSGAFPTYVCLNPGDGDFLSIPADPLNPCPQNGTLISTLISDFPFDGGRADVEVADLNLDGFNDIITADTGATRGAQFCLNDGNEPPFFNCAQVSGAGIASSSVEVGDFDGVNGPDIIVDSSLCLNDGSASFSTACTAIAGVTSFVSGAGQLNNDALPDITSTGGQTCINNGGAVPTFTCSAGGATGTSSTFADVNGDSFIDIVAANGNVCLSDGAAAPAFTCTSVNTTFGQAAVGHINDDNYPDLAFSGSAEFCINSGPPTFTFACSPAGAPAGNGVGIADFDSDAYGDLVFNRPGGITTCLNDGAGSFPACNSVVGSPTGANGPLAIAELGQGAPPNPVPMLLSLSRTFGTVGETPFTLTLTGLDFVPGAIVTFNGVAQTTTFVNSTTLTVEFTGALLAVSQVFQIEVANPTPGGGPAPTPRFFTVNPPAPTITSLSMPVSTVGAPPFTQTVTGTNFDASSVVRFDGIAQPTTFVSPTQVTVQITATELAAPGTVAITVFNPASGLSNASTFMVNAPAVPIIVTGVPDNTTAGDGVCTLREAINNANSNSDTTGGDCAAGSGSDTINLPAGTYALAIAGADEDANATGDFDFTDAAATSIIGAGERTTILDGGGIDRLFDIFGAGLVTIEKVSLINGAVSGANARGAAVRANVGADLAMSVCSVRNNSTGAGSNTDGGAVSLEPGGTVTGAIDRCTFVGNSAMGHAGAIMNFGPGALTVTNSTLTGNTANGRGAAIESVGPATIDFSTITNNTAGAGEAAVSSHGASPGTVTISNSIIADQAAGTSDCQSASGGLLASGDYNIESGTTCGFAQTNDQQNVSAAALALGALANNGGPTDTHALMAGSVALDAIPNATNGCGTTVTQDQRGEARPASGACDIGAFEGTLGNPVPILTSLAPTMAMVGDVPVTLVVTGIDFIASSSVLFDGVPRPTTFINSTTLTVEITAGDLAAVQVVSVTVGTPAPGGGASAPLDFTVNPAVIPVPTLTSLSMPTNIVGAAPYTLMVLGADFGAGATVNFDGVARPTTIIDVNTLSVAITAADLAVVQTFLVTVTTPGGTSGALPFAVNNPAPAVTTLSQTTAFVGEAPFTMIVTGAGFTAGSAVIFNGVARATTFVDATTLTSEITAADLATAQASALFVMTPAPGGGASAVLPFTVGNVAPAITSLGPAELPAGSPATTLRVTGTGFIDGAVITVAGSDLLTTFISATLLRATLPASQLSSAGTRTVVVRNPGSANSNPLILRVNPGPRITGLQPATALAGDPSNLIVAIVGENFIGFLEAFAAGVRVPGTLQSTTRFRAEIPPNLRTAVGFLAIELRTGNGVPTNPMNLQLLGPVVSSANIQGPAGNQAAQALPMLIINGSGFAPLGDVGVSLGGNDLPVASASATTIIAPVPVAAVQDGAAVVVANFGAIFSQPVAAVDETEQQLLTLSGLSPAFATVGASSFQVMLTGDGFGPESRVNFGPLTLTPTSSSPTSLTVILPQSLLSSPGTLQVSVIGGLGQISGSLPFTVNAALTLAPPEMLETPAAEPIEIQIEVGGGTGELVYLAPNGLPPGLMLDPLTGILSGTVLAQGEYSIDIVASDEGGTSVAQTYMLDVAGDFDVPQELALELGSEVGSNEQIMGVMSTTDQPIDYTAEATGDFLQIDPGDQSGTIAPGETATVLVEVIDEGLEPGVFTADVIITDVTPPPGGAVAQGALPLAVIPFTVTVNPTGDVDVDGNPTFGILRPTQTGLTFGGTLDGPAPADQSFGVGNPGLIAINWQIEVNTQDTGAWLSVTPNSGSSLPQAAIPQVTVSIDPGLVNLEPGINPPALYGQLTIQSNEAANSPERLTVVFDLDAAAGPPAQTLAPPMPRAPAVENQQGCVPTTLTMNFLSPTVGTAVKFGFPAVVRIDAADDCGQPMVNGTVSVAFSNGDPQLYLNSLRNGQWEGTWPQQNSVEQGVTLTAFGTRRISDTLRVEGMVELVSGIVDNAAAPPVILALTNSAGFQEVNVAPGMLMSIFGQNLGFELEVATSLPLPEELGGTATQMGPAFAGMIFGSPNQANVQAPFQSLPHTVAPVTVFRSDLAISNRVDSRIATSQPGIFVNGNTLLPIVTDPSFRLIDPQRPIQPGDVLIAFMSGLGPVSADVGTGEPSPAVPATTIAPVTMLIDGIEVTPLFAGLTPGFVGLYQLNFIVPEQVAGDGPPHLIFVVIVGDQSSPEFRLPVER